MKILSFREKVEVMTPEANNDLYKQALEMGEHLSELATTDVLIEFGKILEEIGITMPSANISLIEPSVRFAAVSLISKLVVDKLDRAKLVELIKENSEQGKGLPYPEYAHPVGTFATYIYVFAVHKFDEFCGKIQADADKANKEHQQANISHIVEKFDIPAHKLWGEPDTDKIGKAVSIFMDGQKVGEASGVSLEYKDIPIDAKASQAMRITNEMLKDEVRQAKEKFRELKSGFTYIRENDELKKFAANLMWIIGEKFSKQYGIAIEPNAKRIIKFSTGEDLTNLQLMLLIATVNEDVEKTLGLKDRIQRENLTTLHDLADKQYSLIDVLADANEKGIGVTFYRYENSASGFNVTVSQGGKVRPINIKIFSPTDYDEQRVCEHIIESIKRLMK